MSGSGSDSRLAWLEQYTRPKDEPDRPPPPPPRQARVSDAQAAVTVRKSYLQENQRQKAAEDAQAEAKVTHERSLEQPFARYLRARDEVLKTWTDIVGPDGFEPALSVARPAQNAPEWEFVEYSQKT